MKLRLTTWLLLLAVLVLGGYIVLFDSRQPSTADKVRRLQHLFDVQPDRIQRVGIAVNGLTIECERQHNGWFIVQPIRARADPAQIERLLYGLEDLPMIEKITAVQVRSGGMTPFDYRLDRPRATITVGERGRTPLQIAVGGTSPVGGALYVQFTNSTDILVTSTSLMTLLPASVTAWRDRRFLYRDPILARRIDLQWPDGFVQLVWSGTKWMMQQPLMAAADAAQIERLLTSLQQLAIVDFVADTQPDPLAYRLGVDDAAAQAALWWEGDEIGLRIFFGKEASTSNSLIYARRGDSDSIFTLPRTILDAWPAKPIDLRDHSVIPFSLSDVVLMSIQQGEYRTMLERRGADAWHITEPVQNRADNEIMRHVVAHLTSLRAAHFFEINATNMTALGFQPPSLSVEFGLATPATNTAVSATPPVRPRLLIGGVESGGAMVRAMFENERVGFVIPMDNLRFAPGGAAVDGLLLPVNWLWYRDRTILQLNAARIRRITRVTAGWPETIIERGEGDAWSVVAPTEGVVNSTALADVLRAVAGIRAQRIVSGDAGVADPYGFDAFQLRLSFGLRGERALVKVLIVGARAPEGGLYTMLQGEDTVFVLSDELFERLRHPLVR